MTPRSRGWSCRSPASCYQTRLTESVPEGEAPASLFFRASSDRRSARSSLSANGCLSRKTFVPAPEPLMARKRTDSSRSSWPGSCGIRSIPATPPEKQAIDGESRQRKPARTSRRRQARSSFRQSRPYIPLRPPNALDRPGPGRRTPFATAALRRNPLEFLEGLARDYGDVSRFRLGPVFVYLVNDPELIRSVLVTRADAYHKGRALERAKRLLGEGLLTSEESVHLRQRRLMQPAFHRERISGYGETMVRYAERAGERWKGGETIDVHREMVGLTLAIVGKTLFDADVEGEADEIGGRSPKYGAVPTPPDGSVRRSARKASAPSTPGSRGARAARATIARLMRSGEEPARPDGPADPAHPRAGHRGRRRRDDRRAVARRGHDDLPRGARDDGQRPDVDLAPSLAEPGGGSPPPRGAGSRPRRPAARRGRPSAPPLHRDGAGGVDAPLSAGLDRRTPRDRWSGSRGYGFRRGRSSCSLSGSPTGTHASSRTLSASIRCGSRRKLSPPARSSPTFPSAAGRASASARVSRGWRESSSSRRSRDAGG